MSEVATSDRIRRTAAVLVLASLPAVVAQGVVGRATALVDTWGVGPTPLGGGAPLLALGAVPLVALSACVLVLAPGLLAALAMGWARTPDGWLLHGFALSLVGVSVISGMVQEVAGPLRGSAYGVLLLVLTAATAAWATLRARRASLPLPEAGRAATWLALGTWMLLLGLTPKLLWESFNGDGAHAFESSRRLLYHAMPFWPPDAGPVTGFPGLTSMLYAFPNAWFLRLFGEVEYAARVPMLLYLAVLMAAVRYLGERGAPQRPSPWWEHSGLVLGGVAYLLAMACSATYSPYSADLALPATQDTLLMIVCLGAFAAARDRAWGWLALFTVLTYVSLPSGLLLIAFFLVARALVERPVPWRELVVGAAMLVGAMVMAGVLGRVVVALGAPPPGGEYGIAGILRYFAFLQLTDVHRLLYVAIPAGLIPVVVLVAWRSHDAQARVLALVTLAYFLFFYVQAHVALHHFVPAMILPMAVAWRYQRQRPHSPLVRAWAPMALVAVALAFPWGRSAIHRDGREVGHRVVVRIPGYDRAAAPPMRASTLMDRLFRYDWDPAVPAVYGGSPLVWNRYAWHQEEIPPEANYVVQAVTTPAPAGFRLEGADSTGSALYVRSDSVLAADRARRPASPAGARMLQVPRGILFRGIPQDGGPAIIDVLQALERLGFDTGPILDRLGIPRRGAG